MKIIRKYVFETNSSSMHALVISKSEEKLETPTELHLAWDGSYSWENEVYTDQVNKFTYLGILAAGIQEQEVNNELENYFEKLKEIGFTIGDWEDNEKEIKKKLLKNWDYYIDHGSEAYGAYMSIVYDKERLKRFMLSPKSFITTGNDNEDESIWSKPDAMFKLGLTYEESDWGTKHYNIEPLEENYEIYHKGN